MNRNSSTATIAFGRKVCDIRNRANINIRGLARMTSTSAAWISYIERGQRQPSWDLVEDIVQFFGGMGVAPRDLKELETLGRKIVLEKTFKPAPVDPIRLRISPN